MEQQNSEANTRFLEVILRDMENIAAKYTHYKPRSALFKTALNMFGEAINLRSAIGFYTGPLLDEELFGVHSVDVAESMTGFVSIIRFKDKAGHPDPVPNELGTAWERTLYSGNDKNFTKIFDSIAPVKGIHEFVCPNGWEFHHGGFPEITQQQIDGNRKMFLFRKLDVIFNYGNIRIKFTFNAADEPTQT